MEGRKVNNPIWGKGVIVEDLVASGAYEVKASMSYLLEGLK